MCSSFFGYDVAKLFCDMTLLTFNLGPGLTGVVKSGQVCNFLIGFDVSQNGSKEFQKLTTKSSI
jgi:hypothetical protein